VSSPVSCPLRGCANFRLHEGMKFGLLIQSQLGAGIAGRPPLRHEFGESVPLLGGEEGVRTLVWSEITGMVAMPQ
jgi:hypothetical protein